MGDASGIGPEIILKTVYSVQRRNTRFVCIGSYQIMEERAYDLRRLGFPVKIIGIKSVEEATSADPQVLYLLDITKDNKIEYDLGKVSPGSAEHAVDAVLEALSIAKRMPDINLITAPLSKQAIQLTKYKNFKGHKEILDDFFNIRTLNMIISSPFSKNPLRLVHVTSHIPLRRVSEFLLSENAAGKIEQIINLANSGLEKLGIESPRIAVTGINPHLEEWDEDERGGLGKEEKYSILPAIKNLQANGLLVEGPMTADTAYRLMKQGNYDLTVGMFHDQSHIVSNSLPQFFSTNIIITIGLPFLRLSTSHGLALDIANKFVADPTQMINCVRFILKKALYR
jgi:4-hydroxythreonine-4-phosphate dehydrogenase